MGLCGPKPKKIMSTQWSANLAYAIGLIVTDGCLYRHKVCVNLTSKDLEMIKNFEKALNIEGYYKIGRKSRGINLDDKKYFVIQISNSIFYNFLKSIGITPAKSLTLGAVNIPDEYFFDFLRGCLDGDGCSYSYWDPRWKSSFMFYICFASASGVFINWIQATITRLVDLKGHITTRKKKGNKNAFYQLKYSKYEAIKLARLLYANHTCIKLSRKYLKIQASLGIVREHKGRIFVR